MKNRVVVLGIVGIIAVVAVAWVYFLPVLSQVGGADAPIAAVYALSEAELQEEANSYPPVVTQSITETYYFPVIMKDGREETAISINYLTISTLGLSWQKAFDGSASLNSYIDFSSGISASWDELYQKYYYSIDRGYIEFQLPNDYTQDQVISIKLPYGCTALSSDSSNTIYEIRGGLWNGQLGVGSPKEMWDTLYDNAVIGTINSNDCTNPDIPTLDDSQLVPLNLTGYQEGDTVKLVFIHPDDSTVVGNNPAPSGDWYGWALYANTEEAADLSVILMSP